MKTLCYVRALTLLVPILAALMLTDPSVAQAPPPAVAATLPSETPAQFKPGTDNFDYARRDVMIPMRDGMRLNTVVLVSNGAKNAPILLTRPPYEAYELHARLH